MPRLQLEKFKGWAQSAQGQALMGCAVGLLLSIPCTLYRIEEKSLWVDEVFTILMSGKDLTNLFHNFFPNEPSMLPYYTLMHAWLKLGNSELVLRGLSAIFAIAAIPVFNRLALVLYGARVSMIASLLLPLNAFFIHYAQEARGYSLLFFLVTVSSYYFVKGLDNPSFRNWLFYIVSSVLASYTHIFGFLVTCSHAVSLISFKRNRLPFKSVLASVLSVTFLVLPLIVALLQWGSDLWISKPTLTDICRTFYRLSGSYVPSLLGYFAACILACTLGVVRQLLKTGRFPERWRYTFVITWFLLPILAVFLFSVFIMPAFVIRYFIICLPPFILLVSLGVSKIKGARALTGALLTLVLCSGFGLFHWYTSPPQEDWRGATSFVLKDAREGDAIVFYAYFVRPSFEYYAYRFGASTGVPAVLELASREYSPGGGKRQPEPNEQLLNHLAEVYPRIWLVLSQHRLKRDPGLELRSFHIRKSLEQQYTLAKTEIFKGIDVLLYHIP